MKLVAVLGKYNGPDVLSVTRNCRKGHDLSIELLEAGYAVYDCFLDLHWALIHEIPMQTFKNNCIEIIKRCDAIVLTEGWQKSKGVAKELEIAKELNIPWFEDIGNLNAWRAGKGWE